MLKKEARQRFRSARKALTPAQKEKLDDLLLIQFQKLMLPPLQAVLSFYPIDEKYEVNTFILTRFLEFRNPGLLVCYPRTELFQNTMQAVVTGKQTEFVLNPYGIPEPDGTEVLDAAELDVVLVPLLGFDGRGARVGYGKGFYDRYLQHCRPDCLKIGFCYFEAVDQIDDANEFDVPLNYCITPQKIYVF
jgi:5-formyltetrahydrofolate cyclo-ligase